jgi:hypothetical protein
MAVTEQQIIQFILSGGDVNDLLKSKEVGPGRLLQALINNPSIIGQAQDYAGGATQGLEQYDATLDYTGGTYTNPIQQKYSMMGGPIGALAQEYFGTVEAMGNNPTRTEQLNQVLKQTAIDKYGLSEQDAAGLLTAMDEDRDKYMSGQLKFEKENYKAYSGRRKELGLKKGDPAFSTVVGQSLGFEELSALPKADETFSSVAKKLVAERKRAAAEGVKQKRGDKLAAIPDMAKSVEKLAGVSDRDMKRFERAFVMQAEKVAGKGATPYTQTLKKLLPVIAARKGKI